MFNLNQGGMTPPIRPNGPQVIDPRAQYEQDSILADTLLRASQQYQGGGGIGALAQIVNAFAAQKVGERAQGSLSAALEQEAQRAQEAARAEAEAARAEREHEFALISARAAAEAENRAPPAAIQIANDMQLTGAERAAFLRQSIGNSGPTVNVNSGPQGPMRDGDFSFIPDPNSPAGFRAVAIPGTDAAREAAAAASEGATTDAARVQAGGIQAIDFGNISSKLDEVERQIGGATTGLGSLTSFLPGTPARDMRADIETLQSDAVMSEMQKLRDESYNGSTGLGQITEREIALLGSSVNSFDQGQSPDEFRRGLQNYRISYNALGQIKNINRLLNAGELDVQTAEQMAAGIARQAQEERSQIGQRQEPQTQPQGGLQISPETQRLLEIY